MKKLLLCLIVLLALPAVVAEVSVKHSLEQKQDGLYVSVFINTSSETDVIDLAELIPENMQIETWTTYSGTAQFESMPGEFMNEEYNINHWKFSDAKDDIELVYKISPKSAEDYDIVSVWFYPDGFNMDKVR
jgi:hypothetical protein